MARPMDWYLLNLDGDPAPGDPLAIRDLARRFLTLAHDADHAATSVRGTSGGDAVTTWIGRSGDAFREEIGALPGDLGKVAASYGRAGRALTGYASVLIEAQAQSERALVAGRRAAHQLTGARAELAAATGALRSAPPVAAAPLAPLLASPGPVGTGIALPDRDAVAAATRNHAAAQARLAHARASTDAAGDDLGTAQRLAQAARDLREQAEDAAVHALRDASHAGIRNRGWFHHLTSHLAGSWHTTVEVCKVAGLVLAVAGLVLTGPVIGTLLTITAVVLLAETLRDYRHGRASPFQVALSIAAVLPGVRLAEGARVGVRLAADARLLREAPEAGTVISRDLSSMPWEREPGQWHSLLSERAQTIARREKRMLRRVTAAVRPHYDDLRGRWPIMPEEERNEAITEIYQSVRRAMHAPRALCTPRPMQPNEYGYATRIGDDFFIDVNNNSGVEPTIATIVHETRHSFQLGQIARLDHGLYAHPHAQVWAHNFSLGNYAHPTIDYVAYRHQPIELDADALEHLIGKSLGRLWPGR